MNWLKEGTWLDCTSTSDLTEIKKEVQWNVLVVSYNITVSGEAWKVCWSAHYALQDDSVKV